MPAPSNFSIRRYAAGDETAIASIFCRAIHEVAVGDYTPEQCLAWSGRRPNVEHWRERCRRKRPFVAEVEGRVAGFCELDPDGHIDCLYVDPDFMRRGIASGLIRRAIDAARAAGVDRVYVEASLTARPVFERAGFRVVAQQSVQVGDQRLVNFRMERAADAS
ncbi:putative N-acetyltransferase YafP [Posidoniimonas corsicana]|uniref:Putative N-acetyltransferase YafP n=1 Tax=Posidoniimonas corsicana TaxID=1938618 RepID=A0A5C5VG94_9BACT|nr:GNAT family N-acetyltransferase [Posidoniimonas corsicana]TWT36662.1 putative N-acetyltransferase YafP [Posidoniimonas corsicana]